MLEDTGGTIAVLLSDKHYLRDRINNIHDLGSKAYNFAAQFLA